MISPVRCRLPSTYDGFVPRSGQNEHSVSALDAAPSTIVLIHGLWLTPRSWEHWIERYVAPSWPGMESEVEALNANPAALAALAAEHIVGHYESIAMRVLRYADPIDGARGRGHR